MSTIDQLRALAATFPADDPRRLACEAGADALARLEYIATIAISPDQLVAQLLSGTPVAP